MNFKNKLLVLITILSTTSNIVPHSGGGAFVGGLATGAVITGVTVGASRHGSRDPEYYRNKRANELNTKIDRLEKKLDKTTNPTERKRIQEQINRYNTQLDNI